MTFGTTLVSFRIYIVVHVAIFHAVVSLPKIPTYIGIVGICREGRILIDGF